MQKIIVRGYSEKDIASMIFIWNEVVREGIAFPQEDELTMETGAKFFSEQTYCGVAVDETTDEVFGMYILHPNNIGRCGHISNASYAVKSGLRGLHIGEKLVKDSLNMAHEFGFHVMQFNAVVATNIHARHLYERIGFQPLGVIPKGFRLKTGEYVDICPYYIEV